MVLSLAPFKTIRTSTDTETSKKLKNNVRYGSNVSCPMNQAKVKPISMDKQLYSEAAKPAIAPKGSRANAVILPNNMPKGTNKIARNTRYIKTFGLG